VRLAIVDGSGKRLAPGEVGEVAASSFVMMAGYWRDPEASAAAVRNGWLHTGDLGLVDEYGWLTLRGRSKDMIISGGYNIYAAEIELVLGQHPKVAQAAVVGVPHPEWGEEVVAFVVKRDAQLDLPSDELDNWCKMHVARFKRPRRYVVKTSLPTNTSGKVVKASLRAEGVGRQ
jgi:long-chain acyl-CoA synthetase